MKKEITKYQTFAGWWHEIGSGIGVDSGSDCEAHAKRVSESAWKACDHHKETWIAAVHSSDAISRDIIRNAMNTLNDHEFKKWLIGYVGEQE